MLKHIVLPALALACAAPAAAEPVTVLVPYGDLDLTKDEGRDVLEARLARATARVCGGTPSARDLVQIQAYRACRAEARVGYETQVQLALDAANARRVAGLAAKIGLLGTF